MFDSKRPTQPATAFEGHAFSLPLRMLSGPAAFAIVYLLPLDGLEAPAHIALSCFAWIVVWWATRPVPWAITGLLPLLIFPLSAIMPFRDTAALYGQRVFPVLLGVMLFGHAFRKHGLAKRIAFGILSIPGVAVSGPRLILMMLIVTAALSALIDDAAAVAIMIPIVLPMTRVLDLNVPLVLGAAMGGGIFGDHCSPISDSTIVASMASATDHIEHVRTQLPYALMAAAGALFLFLVFGFLA